MPYENFSLKRSLYRLALRTLALPDLVRVFWRGEQERWSLWLVVAFAGGIGLYFSLPTEPPLWVGFALLAATLLAFAACWRHRLDRLTFVVLPLVFVTAGLTAAQVRTASVSSPSLQASIGPVRVFGQVETAEPIGARWRVVLDHVKIDGMESTQTPERLRLSLHGESAANLQAGDSIRVWARLSPPPSPSLAGEYDFARQAWFDRLGGTGFAVGPVKRLSTSPLSEMGAQLERLRLTITQRYVSGIPGASGAVAAALITGQQGSIPEDVVIAYRDSGLAHLLAISGMNIGLAGGLFFVVGRWLLACWPSVAARWDSKKLMAVAAIASMAIYTALSGSGIPALRSLLMGVCVFGAVLLDRSALSLRVLVASALLVLLGEPESLVGASFQMTYAAVLALVAGYESSTERLGQWRRAAPSPRHKMLRTATVYALGVLLSTLIAGLATAPYSLYHFHRYTVYGLIANAFAVPITTFWVMPWLVLSLLLMPLGIEIIALEPLRWGLDAIEVVARGVARWPHASLWVPPLSVEALALFSLAGVWLCFFRLRWRWGAVPVMIAALSSAWWSPMPPEVIVNARGRLVALGADHGLVLPPERGENFQRSVWLRRWNQAAETPLLSLAPCTRQQDCRVLTRSGASLAWVQTPEGWEDLCPAALGPPAIIVSPMPAPWAVLPDCLRQTVMLDGPTLRARGAVTLWLTPSGPRVETVSQWRGSRPWTPDPADEDED